MLRVSGLDVSIGPIPIIRGASLAIATGEMCGLIGRNGAGKTTLLRALMGAIPATGIAAFDDVDLIALPAHGRVGHGIGYMPEDRRLVPHFSVEDNIRLPTWTTGMDDVEQRLAWIYSIMPEIAAFARRKALELSGGQQKMVALARRLGEVMASLKGEGLSMLIAESNEVHVADLLSRVFRIERGAVEG